MISHNWDLAFQWYPIDRLVNNAIIVAVPEREHAGAATEGFC
jgi:hypothetical protein